MCLLFNIGVTAAQSTFAAARAKHYNMGAAMKKAKA
jgi:hypothetical protein